MNPPVCRVAPRRELLLTALCAPDLGRAGAAWEKLLADCGSEAGALSWINAGSERRVLPLLTLRAADFAVGETLASAATDAMVEAWALNERLFMACERTLSVLGEQGIEMICLKGAAFVGDVYPEHRLRPVGDLDLLVRPSQAKKAFGILKSVGWEPPLGSRVPMRGHGAINLGLSTGASIDLHWRPARDLPHRARRDPLCWDEVIDLPPSNPLARFGVRRPSTADHAVILAAHIMRATNDKMTHPLADFHFLLEASAAGRTPEIDAQRLRQFAASEIARMRTAAVLGFVTETFGTPSPVDPGRLADVDRRSARLETRVIRADARGTTDASGARATLVHAFYGIQAASTGQGLAAKWQVFAAAITAWLDLRLGQRVPWRRKGGGARVVGELP